MYQALFLGLGTRLPAYRASGGLRQTQRYVASGSSLPVRACFDGHAVSSRLRHRLRSAKSWRLADPYHGLFADMNLLLLIAPELRLAPLHALHDTSIRRFPKSCLVSEIIDIFYLKHSLGNLWKYMLFRMFGENIKLINAN